MFLSLPWYLPSWIYSVLLRFCPKTKALVKPAAGSAGCWWLTDELSPAIILSQRKLLYLGLWTLPEDGIHSITGHWRQIKPGPFAKSKTSLKWDPSFHIPLWGQSNLNCSSDSWFHPLLFSSFPHHFQANLLKTLHLRICSQEDWPTPTC